MESYQALREAVEALEQDMAKTAEGNKAAGTRVRKVLRALKGDVHQLVKDTLELSKQ
jgi:cobalamin-dependent methionine synthase I